MAVASCGRAIDERGPCSEQAARARAGVTSPTLTLPCPEVPPRRPRNRDWGQVQHRGRPVPAPVGAAPCCRRFRGSSDPPRSPPGFARWPGLRAVAAQRASAASLFELPPAADLGDGPEPELRDSQRRASARAYPLNSIASASQGSA